MSTFGRLMILVLLVLIPSLSAQIINAIWLHERTSRELRAVAQSNADVYNTELDQIVSGIRRLLGAVAELPALKSLQPRQCGETLAALAKQYPNDVVLAAADLRGVIICSSLPSRLAVSIADRRYFTHGKQGFAVGDFVISRLTGAMALPFAGSIVGSDGAPVGVALAYLSLDWLASDLRRPPLERGRSLLVTDRDGTVLAQVPNTIVPVGTKLPSSLLAMMRADAAGVVDLDDPRGRPTIYGFVPITVPPPDIYLLFGIDRDVAFAPLRAAELRSLALGLLSVLSAFLIAWMVGVRFVRRPIGRLLATAQAWRDGDYRQHANIRDGAPEIRTLGETFDRMVDAVSARDRQLAEALQFKDIIIAAAGHDLRHPLQIILAAIDELSRRPLTPRERLCSERAEKAVQRLSDELDRLLDVIRLRDSTLQVEREPVALGPLLQEVARRWSARAKEKGLRLRARPTDAVIASDRKLLAIILDNLIGNAIKYTEHGGILLGCRRHGDQLRLDVCDTGIGIPADRLESIFHAFQQLNPLKEGFGLGLWIAMSATQALDHELSVCSEPGRGSRFRVTAPLCGAGLRSREDRKVPSTSEPPAGHLAHEQR